MHGGNIYAYIAHFGCAPVDLSASISPYGMPQPVVQAAQQAVQRCGDYPDPFCRAARRAIGAAADLPPDWLYCGAGSADVIDRLARVLRPRTALLTAPAFSEYERALEGAALTFHPLQAQQDFALTDSILPQITPETDVVWLCNPNNPTGRAAAPELLREVAQRCAALDIWLVVDECFLDFAVDCSERTMRPLLARFPKLILLHSYTKIFAMPGIRFGWCETANTALIRALYAAGQPWNVSAAAQACAAAAAEQDGFARKVARQTASARKDLREALTKRGFTVYPSEVNFVLFYADDPALHTKLAERGVLIRSCADFRGLGAGWYRTAVKTQTEHTALLTALDAIREGQG